MILSVVVGVSLVLMIALYSRVVYSLWFQRKDENHLNIQQKVSKVLEKFFISYPFFSSQTLWIKLLASYYIPIFVHRNNTL